VNPFILPGVVEMSEPEPSMPVPFTARATGDTRAHAHPVPDADSALEAALLFIERWLPESVEGEVSVTVVDGETGHQQCFRIDLDDGSSQPC
jgi:hypothetical protein